MFATTAGSAFDAIVQENGAGIHEVQGIKYFGVKKGDRIIGYRLISHVYLNAASNDTAPVATWVTAYTALKSASTKAKGDTILASMTNNEYRVLYAPANDDTAEFRCSCCPVLDDKPGGFGEGAAFGCAFPVALVSTTVVDAQGVSTVQDLPYVAGQCVGCGLRGKHCSLSINTETGTRQGVTLSKAAAKTATSKFSEGKAALDLIAKDLPDTAANKANVKKVRQALSAAQKMVTDARILGSPKK